MTKNYFRIALAIVMILGLFSAVPAKAQGGLTYTSGVQVLNLSGSTANITLIFYNQDGSTAASVPDTIGAHSSKTYYPLSGVSAGFNGSMVIQSDQQVAAIANLVTTDNLYGASTTGFSGGANTFNLPLVMCNNGGFNTFFNVQNAGGGDAHITVNYLKGDFGMNDSETATIAPGASKSFDQTAGSATKNCNTLKGSDTKFLGAAKITSDVPVVASVMQLNTSNFKILMGYNGFAAGSTTVSLPLIMANNSGYYTGMQIQNAGTAATNVTITYSPNTVANGFQPANQTCSNLAIGVSCNLIQNTAGWTNRYIGAATVTSSPAQPLVAIVNQVSLGGSGIGPFGSAYEGFNPATATAAISAPLIMANNSGYYTGYQIQNVAGTTCSSVVVDYGPNVASGGTFNPVNDTFSLGAYSSKTVIQNSDPAHNGGANNWIGVGKYIGSIEVSAPGCSLVMIVNETATKAGDNLFTYDGFNH